MGNQESVADMPGSFPHSAPPSPPPPAPASPELASASSGFRLQPTADEARRAKNKVKREKAKEKKRRKKLGQEQQQPQHRVTSDRVTPLPVPLNPAAALFEPTSTSSAIHPSSSSSPTPTPATLGGSQSQQQMAAPKCQLQSCSKPTSPDDGATVACPLCGVDSIVRYCSKEHLYEDLRHHYLNHCCRLPVLKLGDAMNAPLKARQPRPYFTNIAGTIFGTIEHHRQAVYFAMEGDDNGDYFIFADIAVLGSITNPSTQQIQNCRGTGKLVARIVIPDNDDVYDHRHRRLRFLVVRSLMRGATSEQATQDCVDLAMMIRQQLINEDEWEENMITYLAMGMKQEFGFQLPEEMMV